MAAVVALGATELVAGSLRDTPSLLQSVAGVVIDSAPIALVRAAIDVLGTRDKQVLVAGVVLLSLLFGAGLGLAARQRRRRWVAAAGLAVFAAIGVWAAGRPPGVAPWRPAVAALAGVVAGVATLAVLVWRAPPSDPAGTAITRRSFLIAAGWLVVAGASGGAGGRLLQARARATAREGVVLPGSPGPRRGRGAASRCGDFRPSSRPTRTSTEWTWRPFPRWWTRDGGA